MLASTAIHKALIAVVGGAGIPARGGGGGSSTAGSNTSGDLLKLLAQGPLAAAAAAAAQHVPAGQAPPNPAGVLDEFGAVRPRKRGRHSNDRGAAVGALGRELQVDTTTEFDTFVASAATLAPATASDDAE